MLTLDCFLKIYISEDRKMLFILDMNIKSDSGLRPLREIWSRERHIIFTDVLPVSRKSEFQEAKEKLKLDVRNVVRPLLKKVERYQAGDCYVWIYYR